MHTAIVHILSTPNSFPRMLLTAKSHSGEENQFFLAYSLFSRPDRISFCNLGQDLNSHLNQLEFVPLDATCNE